MEQNSHPQKHTQNSSDQKKPTREELLYEQAKKRGEIVVLKQENNIQEIQQAGRKAAEVARQNKRVQDIRDGKETTELQKLSKTVGGAVSGLGSGIPLVGKQIEEKGESEFERNERLKAQRLRMQVQAAVGKEQEREKKNIIARNVAKVEAPHMVFLVAGMAIFSLFQRVHQQMRNRQDQRQKAMDVATTSGSHQVVNVETNRNGRPMFLSSEEGRQILTFADTVFDHIDAKVQQKTAQLQEELEQTKKELEDAANQNFRLKKEVKAKEDELKTLAVESNGQLQRNSSSSVASSSASVASSSVASSSVASSSAESNDLPSSSCQGQQQQQAGASGSTSVEPSGSSGSQHQQQASFNAGGLNSKPILTIKAPKKGVLVLKPVVSKSSTDLDKFLTQEKERLDEEYKKPTLECEEDGNNFESCSKKVLWADDLVQDSPNLNGSKATSCNDFISNQGTNTASHDTIKAGWDSFGDSFSDDIFI